MQPCIESIRNRVRLREVTTFVDPKSDLAFDKKKKIFLHYLPESNEETNNRNSIRYQLVRYNLGYYIRFLGFFDFKTAVKNYIENSVQLGADVMEAELFERKVTCKLPYRTKEIINGVVHTKKLIENGSEKALLNEKA